MVSIGMALSGMASPGMDQRLIFPLVYPALLKLAQVAPEPWYPHLHRFHCGWIREGPALRHFAMVLLWALVRQCPISLPASAVAAPRELLPALEPEHQLALRHPDRQACSRRCSPKLLAASRHLLADSEDQASGDLLPENLLRIAKELKPARSWREDPVLVYYHYPIPATVFRRAAYSGRNLAASLHIQKMP
jgi:hypothetical protein